MLFTKKRILLKFKEKIAQDSKERNFIIGNDNNNFIISLTTTSTDMSNIITAIQYIH